jgi:hypothetical protein
MKVIFIFIISLLNTDVFSQENNKYHFATNKDTVCLQIQLSKNLNETKMGVWKIGDYIIQIELKAFEDYCQENYLSLLNALENQYKNDSNMTSICTDYANRILNTINQVKKAENGFDLKKLVMYVGKDSNEKNKGNSIDVENYVRQKVESGNAVLFYKGNRIYSLQKLIENDPVFFYY